MYTLKELLTLHTVDQLKALMAYLPDVPRTGKKNDLIEGIQKCLLGTALHAVWSRLDTTQQLAVTEAVYSPDSIFHAGQFKAKYGKLPLFSVKDKECYYSSSSTPTALRLFLYSEESGYILPDDLCEQLKTFVPEPAPFKLKTIETLPEKSGDNTLTVYQSERDALLNLSILLRLVDQGKIQVSDKTSLPGSATLRLLTEHLVGGDFYESKPKQNKWDQEIGAIKAFSWPLLLQSAGLAQQKGGKLALSSAGLKALSASNHADSLQTIWKKWLKSKLIDEFSRIDDIKGQKSKGRVMTAVAPRRAIIDNALRYCPIGAWIDINDFSNFMIVENLTFEVTHNPWKLYICDPEHGSLGYSGFHDWSILQLRYVLCILFEYAAPLGMIDIGYVNPKEARKDFRGLWGVDDLDFLSRYDGLAYFRLTPLGAYCLGISNTYSPASIPSTVRLAAMPSLKINIVAGQLSEEESSVLDTWALQINNEDCWQLDRSKALKAIEKGHDITELRMFLEARDDQPLPEPVDSFIRTCQKRGQALKVVGTALLIECQDDQTAMLIAEHKDTLKLCQRVGNRQLIVRSEHAEKFRVLTHALGFGVSGSL